MAGRELDGLLSRHTDTVPPPADTTRRAGFSLIEVLITLGICAMALIALLKLLGEIHRGGTQARTRAVAAAYAGQCLEEGHALSRAGPGGDISGEEGSLPAGPAALDGVTYRRVCTLTPGESGVIRLYLIKTSIAWDDPGDHAGNHPEGQTHAIHLSTLGAAATVIDSGRIATRRTFIRGP